MFECSSARYFEPRSITTCGTCDEAALSRYTRGFPLTVWDSTGKSFLIFSTSQLPIVLTAVTTHYLLARAVAFAGVAFARAADFAADTALERAVPLTGA